MGSSHDLDPNYAFELWQWGGNMDRYLVITLKCIKHQKEIIFILNSLFAANCV